MEVKVYGGVVATVHKVNIMAASESDRIGSGRPVVSNGS